MMDPEKIDKYLYIKETPNWLIWIVNALGIITWGFVVYGYWNAILYDSFFRWIVGPMLFIFTSYYFLSYGMNLFFYRRLDLKKHQRLLKKYWRHKFWHKDREPSVDVFLPICGEDLALLKNTWEHVSKLDYRNIKVYVLDDSRIECTEHKAMARSYGFEYLERPNKGQTKKAGNLKYGYEHSNGEFIVIFDADFAPRFDFVYELLPYMADKKISIVQSPQYFEMSSAVHKRSPLEYGAAYVQESFYRYIQVSRDYFSGSICCGSNAIYRRKALESIGGPVQIEHSEDAITGFTLTDAGWTVRYVPIILAVGVCPDDVHAYFHQQHRWCTGSMTLLLMKKFWKSAVSWKVKACYFMGFLYYISNLTAIFFSFQLFYSLFAYHQYISIYNGMLFYPYLVYNIVLLLVFPIYGFKWGCFLTRFVQLYSYSHAVITTFMRSTIAWIPTNTKHAGVSSAFSQATKAVFVYIFAYLALAGIALRQGFLHPFNYNYYSLEFWIFYNVFFSLVLLWVMYKAVEDGKKRQFANNGSPASAIVSWRRKTILLTSVLLILMVCGILLI